MFSFLYSFLQLKAIHNIVKKKNSLCRKRVAPISFKKVYQSLNIPFLLCHNNYSNNIVVRKMRKKCLGMDSNIKKNQMVIFMVFMVIKRILFFSSQQEKVDGPIKAKIYLVYFDFF
jgi:hypothetical protein